MSLHQLSSTKHLLPTRHFRLVVCLSRALTLQRLSHRNLGQANVLHHRPHDGQAAGLGRESVNLIGALLDITKQAFNGIGAADVAAHHFGVHNPFSSDYLQMWGNDEQSLLAELETVQRTVTTIIERMEQPFTCEQPHDLAA